MPYIHELKNWPQFHWDKERIHPQLTEIRHRQGRLIGRMESLGFALRGEAVLRSVTEEVVKSSEIEGETLDHSQVRSSVARHLGISISASVKSTRDVDGVVKMLLDATQNFDAPLTERRLFEWHTHLFPEGRTEHSPLRVGKWRDDRNGPMQVVSGPVGKPRVHFEAPAAKRLWIEMAALLKWFNGPLKVDPVIKAAIAHLWLVTIHPFEDGNGRIARAVTDMALARSEGSAQRFYSMSAQICTERKNYYDILEETQKGNLDITAWLQWFLACLGRAFLATETTLATILVQAHFWETHRDTPFNERQRKVIQRLFSGFEGKLTSAKWAALCKCSQDTASRDIDDLLKRKVLQKNPGGGRSTSYRLAN